MIKSTRIMHGCSDHLTLEMEAECLMKNLHDRPKTFYILQFFIVSKMKLSINLGSIPFNKTD